MLKDIIGLLFLDIIRLHLGSLGDGFSQILTYKL